jgi:hypothetical protein
MNGTTPGPGGKYQPIADHKLHIYKEIIRELIVSSEHDDEADTDITLAPVESSPQTSS